jgi:predicted carbohydrate-binding protein with CBM5 and CBM33 domain
MGFYKIKTAAQEDNKIAGNGIIGVSRSVFQPASEWSKFDADPKQWVYDHNYRYCNDDGSFYTKPGWNKLAGFTPDELQLVPVYDTANRMHVRIPHQDNLAHPPATFPKEEPYAGGFPHFLASYFMRRCR